MLCIVLILRLVCGNRVIFEGLKDFGIRRSAFWRLLGLAVGRFPVWRTSMRYDSVIKNRSFWSAVLRTLRGIGLVLDQSDVFLFESRHNQKNAYVGEDEADIGDEDFGYLSFDLDNLSQTCGEESNFEK